jgi:site-specific recombinase XerD
MVTVQDFDVALVERGASGARRSDYRRVLARLAASLKLKSLFEADGADLNAYLAAQATIGHAPSTLRKERQMILSFFTWAYETDRISADALIELRSTVSPQGATGRACPQPYTAKELRKFRHAIAVRWPTMDCVRAERFVRRWKNGASPYSRIRKHAIRLQLDAIVALALHGGLRRGEILALHLDDMHHDNAYIVVWSGKRWQSSNREVPFTDEARVSVKAWLEFRASMGVDHEHPWLNLWSAKSAREPIKPDAFAKLLSSYVGPGLSYRRLRHTCAVSWLRAGMELWEAQQLLGHADLKNTLPYGEAVETDLEARIESLQGPFSEALASAA